MGRTTNPRRAAEAGCDGLAGDGVDDWRDSARMLDHVVIGERHPLRILSKYDDYYNGTRTHLSLAKDAPEPQSVQLPSQGRVVEVPCVGGLHHEYLRRAA